MQHEDGRVVRAVLEVLESRQLLSTYYVSEQGDDGNDGSEAHPWRTIQKAADSVVGGDVVNVLPGEYEGFSVGVRRLARGTANEPIVFNARRRMVLSPYGGYTYEHTTISGSNGQSPDGIYVAPGSAHVVIRGFTITDLGGELRSAIRVKQAEHVTLRDNWAYGDGDSAFAAVRSDGLVMAKNEVNAGWTTGILVSGGEGTNLKRNHVRGTRVGIELRTDPITGESVRNADVQGNTVYRLGRGGTAMHLSGVRGSRFQNNMLLGNRGDGMVFEANRKSGPSRHNLVVNNTINHESINGWGLVLAGGTSGTVVLNNILINGRAAAGAGGSLRVGTDSLAGLEVDYNIYDGRLSADGGASVVTLDAWRGQLGQDAHSFLGDVAMLFTNQWYAHPFGRSPGIDAGTTRHAPADDGAGNARIDAPDIGALEAGYENSFEGAGRVSGAEYDGVTVMNWTQFTGLTPAFYDDFEEKETMTVEQPLGPGWEVLAWPGGGDGTPDSDVTVGVTLRGALLRSTVEVSGSVEGTMYVTPVIGPVTSGATGVFGIGNTFGGVSGNYWAAFVSRGDEDILYAELNLDGAVQRLKIGPRTSFNSSLRIEPTEGGFAFYNQSKLITTLQGTFPDDVERRLLMGSHGEALEMHVYHVAAGPFTSGGTYTSPVYDESVSGGWGRLVESSFEQLQGTSLMYETRTGQTATPDDSWSAWEVVGEDDLIVSPEGRYIQFRVTFVTADPDRTPMWFGLLYEIRPAA